MLSTQELQAIDYYNEKIKEGNTHDQPVWVDGFSMSVFADFPENGVVIDIGCGIGRSLPMLPDLGITRYFGIDPAADCIAYCKKMYETSAVRFAVNDIQHVGESYANTFDGFLCLAVLMHIPRKDLHIAIGSLRNCLRIGAHGLFSIPYAEEGDPPEYVSPVADILCTLYSIAEIDTALDANKFEILDVRTGENMYLVHVIAV